MLTREESADRIARLQHKLIEQQMDGALLIFPIDLYYFSGALQNAVLWVPAQGQPLLLVRKSLARAREECLFAEVLPFPPSKEFASVLPTSAHKIGLTFDVLPVAQYNFFAKLLPGREFVDLSGLNRELRSVKSPWELERMRYSGAKLCEVFAQVPEILQPGMREIDLAAEFEARLRKAGGEGYVRMRAFNQEFFMGLAVAGGSACAPGFFDGPVTGRGLSSAFPQGASAQRIEKNCPVLIDYTGVFEGYIVDMTRMFVIGTLDSQLQQAFDLARAIQDQLAENLRPGAVCAELFAQAFALAEQAGLARHFMGSPGENARFVGHGVGLELDEFPVLAQGFNMPLKIGQTIAIEPKFVFPGLGAIGIENTWAVTEKGGEKLTNMPDALVHL